MARRPESRLFGLAALAWVIAYGCDNSDGDGSETHLAQCQNDAECADAGPDARCVKGQCRTANVDAGGGAAGGAGGSDGGTATAGSGAGGASGGASGGSSGTSGSGGSSDSASGGAGGAGGTLADAGHSDADASGASGTGGGSSGGSASGGAGGAGGTSGTAGQAGSGDAGLVPQDEAVVSGTRLKGKYVMGPDGSRVYRRGVLHDSQLGVDCKYRTAADGVTRCLPEVQDLSAPGGGAIVFTDNTCTTGLTFLPPPTPGCTPAVPAYVLRFDSSAYCAGSQNAHVYPVGSITSPPVVTVYRRDDTTSECVPTSLPQSGLTYTLGAEVPASTFVAGTPEQLP